MQQLPWKKVKDFFRPKTDCQMCRALKDKDFKWNLDQTILLCDLHMSLIKSPVVAPRSLPSTIPLEDQTLKGTPHQAKFRKLLWEIHLHLTEPSVTASLVSEHLRKGRSLAHRLEKFLLTTGLERGL